MFPTTTNIFIFPPFTHIHFFCTHALSAIEIVLAQRPNIIFPRIAIKTEINPDALVIRETEKVLDEKITTRTEEIVDDVTGLSHLRTVQVVEKIIETEVCVCVSCLVLSTALTTSGVA